ncbi:glycine betaine ABC transporter substrate-binding protein [Streptomyces sp. NPDC058464]|uniref:glycine betaine ABC transporter substrate-binding protein n=1 Tax=Streptomyces sp. NPDC058464 TaxID=3346511 RepID=UPI00366081FC
MIGTDTSAGSRVVAALYDELLTRAGATVRMTHTRYTSAADTARAVTTGRLGLAPAYETTALRALRATQFVSGDMAATLSMALPPGVIALSPAKAQRGLVLAVTRATARKRTLHTLADLAGVHGRLTLGGPAAHDTDAPSTAELHQAYGADLTATGTSTTADVLVLHGTDPALTRDNLVVLTDPKGVVPPEHVFPLIAASYADLTARKALARLNSRLTTQQLTILTASVADGVSPTRAADGWLRDNGLLP